MNIQKIKAFSFQWLNNKITSFPEIILITHRMTWEYNGIKQNKFTLGRYPYMLKYQLILFGNFIINSSTSIKKEIFYDIGFINESEKYFGVEDFDYFLRISTKYKNSKYLIIFVLIFI